MNEDIDIEDKTALHRRCDSNMSYTVNAICCPVKCDVKVTDAMISLLIRGTFTALRCECLAKCRLLEIFKVIKIFIPVLTNIVQPGSTSSSRDPWDRELLLIRVFTMHVSECYFV